VEVGVRSRRFVGEEEGSCSQKTYLEKRRSERNIGKAVDSFRRYYFIFGASGRSLKPKFYFKKKFVKVKMVLGPLLPHVPLPMLAYRCYSFFIPQLVT
jgi:hypothetical protein